MHPPPPLHPPSPLAALPRGVYDERFSFLPDAFTRHSVTFPPPDAVRVRSRLRPRTICNFPLDMRQEFRAVYPRSVPSRDCRRGERWRAEINLGRSPPFSFREKETAAFPSFSFSSRPPRPRRSNSNWIATKPRDTRNTWVAFTPVFSYATRSTANYAGNDTLHEAEIARCSPGVLLSKRQRNGILIAEYCGLRAQLNHYLFFFSGKCTIELFIILLIL